MELRFFFFLVKCSTSLQVYMYALTIVDVAGKFKAAEPLTSKNSSVVLRAFQTIYDCRPLRWPKVLQVDPGRKVMGDVTTEMTKHTVRIRRGNVNFHRHQGILERFNRTLGKRLFTFPYSQEINFKEGERSTEWLKGVPVVVLTLNNEVTGLTGKKPVNAIKDKSIDAKSSTTYSRTVGLKEKRLDSSNNVRYLYAAGELGGGQRRATDSLWSLKVFDIEKSLLNKSEPVLHYMKNEPRRGFIKEELHIGLPRT